MTVALPILSACGIETCILPTAVLSTHTGGFQNYTVHDLAGEIPAIIAHWQKEAILFDAVYTGYLGSVQHIALVEQIAETLLKKDGALIVDPAMADNGRLYPAFDNAYVKEMKRLCSRADIILPNLTEACLLSGVSYDPNCSREDLHAIRGKLGTDAMVIMTGIGFRPQETGVAIFSGEDFTHYAHRRIDRNFHGTGDIFASAFTGAYLQNGDAFSAAKTAADYTLSCIENTLDDAEHWYGVKFEPELPGLMRSMIKGEA